MTSWINDRELRILEIFGMSMLIFRKNFKKIAFVVFSVFLPIALLHTVIITQLFLTADSLAILMQVGGMESSEFVEMAIAYGGNQLLQVMVFLWLEPVGIIAVAKLTRAYITEENLSPKEAIGDGLNCLGKYMLAGVFVALLVGLGFFLFVLPSIYFGVLTCFYLYAIGLSGESGKQSIRYSASLVKGRWIQIFGFVLFTWFLSVGFNTVIDLVTMMAGDGFLGTALYMTLSYFTKSLIVICTTILFMNREMLVHGIRLSKAPIEEVVIEEI